MCCEHPISEQPLSFKSVKLNLRICFFRCTTWTRRIASNFNRNRKSNEILTKTNTKIPSSKIRRHSRFTHPPEMTSRQLQPETAWQQLLSTTADASKQRQIRRRRNAVRENPKNGNTRKRKWIPTKNSWLNKSKKNGFETSRHSTLKLYSRNSTHQLRNICSKITQPRRIKFTICTQILNRVPLRQAPIILGLQCPMFTLAMKVSKHLNLIIFENKKTMKTWRSINASTKWRANSVFF